MKSLFSIVLVLLLFSCKSHKSKVNYADVRVPYDNMAVKNTFKSSAVKDVEKEINYYRFKEDLSRTPVSNISFDALPSKVIIDDLDIKHDDIYKLKKPKVKKKYTSPKKKKRKVRRKRRSRNQNKAQISRAAYKKGYVDLSQKPENQKTKKQNVQYQNAKQAQIESMKRNAQTVKQPVSQHQMSQPSHNVGTKATKEELEKKLNSLQARHNVLVDNKAITNNNPHSNTITAANPSQPPAVQLPQSGQAVAIPSMSATQGQAPAIPTTQGQAPQQSQMASQPMALPQPPAIPAPESSPPMPTLPSINGVPQVPDVGQAPQPAAPAPAASTTPNVVSSVKDPNSMAGIPPSPQIPSNFSIDSKSSVLQPVKPQDSSKGKKVIKIMKDMSLKKESHPAANASDWQNSSWTDPKSSFQIQGKGQQQQPNDSKNKSRIQELVSHSLKTK